MTSVERETVAPILQFRHDRDDAIRADPLNGWMALSARYRAFGSDQGPAPVWFVLNYEDICTVMHDWGTFSRRYTDAYSDPTDPPLIPIHLDPPEHTKYRRLLNPLLTPQFARALDPTVRQRAIDLTEEYRDRGEIEFMYEFAFRYAPVIFLGLMGMDADAADRVTALVDRALHITEEQDPDGSIRRADYAELAGLINQVIAERRARPGDDFISSLVSATVDDRPIDPEALQQLCLLLLMAGLDTVAATLGYTMHHFATHADDRRRIVADPALIPGAVEESLRYYPINASIRYVTKETEFAGCPMRPGDRVVLPFVAANRDPAEFSEPDRFDMEREVNRHISFGVGPHRCAGSHLARVELAIALEEWHKRIPDYRVANGADLQHIVSTRIYRLDRLPLVWA